ncbi:hypothetical protein BJ138DRAFT_1120932 [Hygrophoropsis aurantiaca]|uniref:Uncharacterized protein n=1 Tax=Hygrophoropsis aurantiaca TaxID=72124 RepID=A0ACB7ZQ88_9AGAM|nr:hypothetical protein BJ138DRAFT_1120932 [Hygrophoropsis aurantiaca]
MRSGSLAVAVNLDKSVEGSNFPDPSPEEDTHHADEDISYILNALRVVTLPQPNTNAACGALMRLGDQLPAPELWVGTPEVGLQDSEQVGNGNREATGKAKDEKMRPSARKSFVR